MARGSAVVRETSLQTMTFASIPSPSPPNSSGTSYCQIPSCSTLGRSCFCSSFCCVISLTTARSSGISSRSTNLRRLSFRSRSSSGSSKSIPSSLESPACPGNDRAPLWVAKWDAMERLTGSFASLHTLDEAGRGLPFRAGVGVAYP